MDNSILISHNGCTEEPDGDGYVTRGASGKFLFWCDKSRAQLKAESTRIQAALVAAGIDHWQCPCSTEYAADDDGRVYCPTCGHKPRPNRCCGCGNAIKPTDADRCRPEPTLCRACSGE